MNILIRKETQADYQVTESVVKQAFDLLEFSDQKESIIRSSASRRPLYGGYNHLLKCLTRYLWHWSCKSTLWITLPGLCNIQVNFLNKWSF